MNERFLIPSVVAVTLHALVLFGFNHGRPPVIAISDPGVVLNPPPPIKTVEVKWETYPSDTDPTPPKGKPDEALPDLPEPPAPAVVVEIPMPLAPPNLSPTHNTSTIPTGPIGIPDGIDHTGPSGPGFVHASLLDNPPRTRAQLAPIYPAEARQAGLPGEVVVEFVVDEAGRVLDPHVLHSNSPLFDAPTLRAVSKWRFEPGRKDGRVVRFRMSVPVEFALNQ